MELEIVDRQLAVALDEADRDLALAQHALDAQGDLGLVGALHQHAASFRLDHRGVVDLDAAGAGERRLLVGVDRPELEVRIAPFHDLEDVAGTLRGRVARVIEVGDCDVAIERVDHAQGGRRRRVDLLARQVDMAVVEVERHIGERAHPHGGDDDAGDIELAAPGSGTDVERQPEGGPEHRHDGHEPSAEPKQGDDLERMVFHRFSAARARALSGKVPTG